MTRLPLIIDTDPGQDDAIALLLAAGLACAEPSVQGNNTKAAPAKAATAKSSAKKAPAKPAPAPLAEAGPEQLAAAEQAYMASPERAEKFALPKPAITQLRIAKVDVFK